MALQNNTKCKSSKRTRAIKEKLSRQKTIWQKLVESEPHMALVVSYCGFFLLYGMSDEILGPTLIELSCLASKALKSMSWLFFSHDLGLLFGTLFGGIIVSSVDKNLAITICLLSNAACITILPILHRYVGMILFVLFYGVFLGIPDTLSNVMLVNVFGKEVAPYLQGVHFFYGFGAFLIPLIARPFLRRECSYQVNTTTYFSSPIAPINVTYDNETGLWSSKLTEQRLDSSSDVMYAYWVTSLLHVPVILGLSWLYFKRHLDHQKGIYRDSFTSLHNDDELPVNSLDIIPFDPDATFWERIQKNAKQRLLAVTILCSLLMYIYEGLMAMFGGYAYSFAVKGVAGMTSDQGAYLTSMYWGFFALGRFLCIILAFLITPKSMLMANVVGCLISAIVLVSGHAKIETVFVGTCMLGFCLSSTAPTIISMAEQYVDLTAHTTSTLVISSALGELTLPIIVGQAFERFGPTVFPTTVVLLCLLGFVGYCLLLTFDNDKAYEHASSMIRIVKNFLCFGCESEKQKRYRDYALIEQSLSEYPSSSDISDPDSSKVIPKPIVTAQKMQPPEMELIDEDDIIGDYVYEGSENVLPVETDLEVGNGNAH